MSKGPQRPVDDSNSAVERLLQEAKRLQDLTNTSTSTVRSKGTDSAIESIQTIADNLNFFRKTLLAIREVWLGLVENIFRPVWNVLGPPLSWIIERYKKIWLRFAYRLDKNTGERKLSRRRSSLLLALTFLVIAGATPTTLGSAIRFVTTEPLTDGLLMAFSLRTETFYLNNSEEIDPENNIHSVRGCKTEGLCGEKDAAYFRVQPRLSHDIWKFAIYRNPIYVPDHVVAPIAPGVNKCQVTYYGYRMTTPWISRLLRSFQVYPTMLEASCQYVASPQQLHSFTVKNPSRPMNMGRKRLRQP